MAKACQSAGIQVVTGDTKVVQKKGAIDKAFINTAWRDSKWTGLGRTSHSSQVIRLS